MSKYAITARGVGNKVGARLVKDGWELIGNESFMFDGELPPYPTLDVDGETIVEGVAPEVITYA